MTIEMLPINGRLGLLASFDGVVAGSVDLEIDGDRIMLARLVLNPDKLRGLQR
jgi:hypothetical protein